MDPEDSLHDLINVADFAQRARTVLPTMVMGYYESGAHDEHALRANRAAFAEWLIHYKVMVDVSERDMETGFFGARVAAPIAVAPTAFQRMASANGEIDTVTACGAANLPMFLSTLSTTPMEAVLANAKAPVWFQLYVYKDRGATRALIERAEAAGCAGIALTVDAPILGTRERDVRNGFHLPDGLEVANLSGDPKAKLPAAARESGLSAYVSSLLDPALTWEVLDWVLKTTKLPVILKGVVRPDDAREAVERGVSGLVVSNHGGRQLDASPATLDVLGPIVDAVGDEIPVLMDGGIRRGSDVYKALALGAQSVLVGRPILWGLACGGRAGASKVLDILMGELDEVMALAGTPRIPMIGKDMLRRR